MFVFIRLGRSVAVARAQPLYRPRPFLLPRQTLLAFTTPSTPTPNPKEEKKLSTKLIDDEEPEERSAPGSSALSRIYQRIRSDSLNYINGTKARLFPLSASLDYIEQFYFMEQYSNDISSSWR